MEQVGRKTAKAVT